LASTSVDDVRDILNIDSSDIADAKVVKMLKRAAVTLGLELSLTIDYADCTDAQKEAISLLTALYCVCFLTGGSAVGLNFSVGDLNTSNSSSLPSLDILRTEFERVLGKLKEPYVGSA
jgi:hypothetical protein